MRVQQPFTSLIYHNDASTMWHKPIKTMRRTLLQINIQNFHGITTSNSAKPARTWKFHVQNCARHFAHRHQHLLLCTASWSVCCRVATVQTVFLYHFFLATTLKYVQHIRRRFMHRRSSEIAAPSPSGAGRQLSISISPIQ